MKMQEGKATSITFVLPGRGTKPVGGFKIIYEYANRLSALGYTVSVLHVACLYKTESIIQGIGRYIYCLFFYRFYKKWFSLNKEVRNEWIFCINDLLVRDSDYIVASSWETAEYVANLAPCKGDKLYLIQGDESGFPHVVERGLEKRVKETWKLPFKKITVSTYLHEKISTIDTSCIKIFNGLEFNDFYVESPIEKREQYTVIMLYHSSALKGCKDGLEALRMVRSKYPELKVTFFGVPVKPNNLENWIEYVQKPTTQQLRKLYNDSAIFISPSYSEGWGLPVAEAMQCGCATITTNIAGFKDFVKENEISLCFTPGDIAALAEKILLLFENNEKRVSLAYAGNRKIQEFTWDRALNGFTNLLTSSHAERKTK